MNAVSPYVHEATMLIRQLTFGWAVRALGLVGCAGALMYKSPGYALSGALIALLGHALLKVTIAAGRVSRMAEVRSCVLERNDPLVVLRWLKSIPRPAAPQMLWPAIGPRQVAIAGAVPVAVVALMLAVGGPVAINGRDSGLPRTEITKEPTVSPGDEGVTAPKPDPPLPTLDPTARNTSTFPPKPPPKLVIDTPPVPEDCADKWYIQIATGTDKNVLRGVAERVRAVGGEFARTGVYATETGRYTVALGCFDRLTADLLKAELNAHGVLQSVPLVTQGKSFRKRVEDPDALK